MNIVGYEFLLDHGRQRTEWTQLHGGGGALGNGALHVQDSAKIGPICLSLLRKARAELEREGTVRRSNDARHGEPLTIEPVAPVAVLDCRPIYERRTHVKINARKLLPGHVIALGNPNDPVVTNVTQDAQRIRPRLGQARRVRSTLRVLARQNVTLHETSHGLRYDDACGCQACEAYCNEIDNGGEH